jgi:hypothetical protein
LILQINAFPLGYSDTFGSLDGICTRFFVLERHSDLSIRPQGYKAGMMGFVGEAFPKGTHVLSLDRRSL